MTLTGPELSLIPIGMVFLWATVMGIIVIRHDRREKRKHPPAPPPPK